MRLVAIGNYLGKAFKFVGDTQAVAHFNRVIADGGIVPAGLIACNAWFLAVKAVYGVTDITTAISAAYDPHYLGVKVGAGSGTTLGQAAQKLYNAAGVSGDLVQATAASMPLLLVKNSSDANYWFSVQAADNYLYSTTTYATSDFDVEFNVTNTTASSTQRVINANAGGNPWSIIFNVNTGVIAVEYYTGGYKVANCSTSLTGSSTFRITRNSTTGAITILKNGVSQTVTGDQVAGALTSFPTELRIGNLSTLAQGYQGKIHWVKFYISGSVVRYMNPASYNAATSQTQWTSTTGEVWTINTGTATTGYKSALVYKTIIQGDGVDDSIYNATAITTKTSFTKYSVQKYWKNAAYFYSNSSLAFLAYTNGSGTPRMAATSEVVYGANSYNTLQMFTANLGVSGLTLVNNAGGNSGDLSGTSGTGIYLFAGSSFANFMNSQMTCYLETIGAQVDNSTQRTAMYNVLRNFDGNAY